MDTSRPPCRTHALVCKGVPCADLSSGDHTRHSPTSGLSGIVEATRSRTRAADPGPSWQGICDSATAELAHIAIPALQPSAASARDTSPQGEVGAMSPGLTFATRVPPSAAPTPLFGAATAFYTPAAAEPAPTPAAPVTLFATPSAPEPTPAGFQKLPAGATREAEARELMSRAALDVSPLMGCLGATAVPDPAQPLGAASAHGSGQAPQGRASTAEAAGASSPPPARTGSNVSASAAGPASKLPKAPARQPGLLAAPALPATGACQLRRFLSHTLLANIGGS